MTINWIAVLDVFQWLCILALFASRSVVKRRLDDLQSGLRSTDELVQDLWHESVNAMLNDCCFCAQTWAWAEREQLDGGAWVHRRLNGKRMVFCGSPSTTDSQDQRDQTPPDTSHHHQPK